MEKIILTQRDADFILSYLRADIERQNKRHDMVCEKEAELKKLKSEVEVKEDPFSTLFVKTLLKSCKEFHSLYKQQTDIAVKCIELLTIGSADV